MTSTALWSERDRRRLVRLCATISGDHDAAEDLAQETLLEAWRARHKLTEPGGADRWLSAVARNVCLRWTTRRRELPVAEVPDHGVEIELKLERDDLADLLDGALALLPGPQREVLLQKYVHDRSNGEIACRLGITDDAVSMRLARGKLALRRALGGEDWRETRVWCVACGARRLEMRREEDGRTVAFRCPACDGSGRSAVFPLDNPVFASLVGDLRQPAAMFGRVGDWALSYWGRGDGSSVACTRCGEPTTVRAHTRRDTPEPTPGLFVRCDACGEELWTSLVGVAIATPEARELRRRAPRTVAVHRDGAVRLGGLEIGFEQPTFRLLDVA